MALKWPRIVWPVLIAATLGLPVAASLAGHVPNIVDEPIVAGRPAWPTVPVDLGTTEQPDGTLRVQVGLAQAAPWELTRHSEIQLFVVTYESRPTLLSGEIRVEGTDCVYRTAPGADLTNNAYLGFRRGSGCTGPAPPTGRFNLVLSIRGPGRVGVETYFVPPDQFNPNWVTFTARDPAAGAPVPVVRGRYSDVQGGPSMRRVHLLGYMWQFKGAVALVWCLVALSVLLVGLGAWLLAPDEQAESEAGTRRETAAGAVGVSCVGLGLALLYVGLAPPLQAPDEPDHLLAFAQVAGRQELAEGTATLAKAGHFDRIRFNGDEHFRRVDIGRPLDTAWGPEVFAHEVAARSVTTWFWWTMLAWLFQSFDAPATLLGVRLANACVFALALGLATLLLRAASRRGVTVAPHMTCAALLLVPTLPFFSTHVSEFALLSSAYVLVTAITVGLFFDRHRSYLLGLPLGVAVSLVLASGRSAMPFAAALVALLAGRALLGPRGKGHESPRWRDSTRFWARFAIGLALFPIVSTAEFRNGLWPADTGQLPSRFRLVAEFLRQQPWLILLVAPVGLAVERTLVWVRRLGGRAWRPPVMLLRVVCYGAAAAVLGSLAASLFVRYPVLLNSETARPASLGAYVVDVFEVAATGFRLDRHDFFLSSSFWAGFGWIDTLPGDRFITGIVLLLAVGLVALLVRLGRTADWRRALWLGVIACGWVAALAAYAVSSYYVNRSLHGRYLLGLYLSACGVSWSVIALLPRARLAGVWRRLGFCREWSLLVLVAGIHAYALHFILLRYF